MANNLLIKRQNQLTQSTMTKLEAREFLRLRINRWWEDGNYTEITTTQLCKFLEAEIVRLMPSYAPHLVAPGGSWMSRIARRLGMKGTPR